MPVRTQLCEVKAERIRRDAGIICPPVNVESLAEMLFLEIVDTKTSDHRWRAMLERGKIHVAAAESPAGKRFSIGHEIGHCLLHPDGFVFSNHESLESELYAENPDKALEDEADYFSGVLLVPPQWLRRDVNAGFMPADLAERYQVSQEVIFIALSRHRLLNRVGRRRR